MADSAKGAILTVRGHCIIRRVSLPREYPVSSRLGYCVMVKRYGVDTLQHFVLECGMQLPTDEVFSA